MSYVSLCADIGILGTRTRERAIGAASVHSSFFTLFPGSRAISHSHSGKKKQAISGKKGEKRTGLLRENAVQEHSAHREISRKKSCTHTHTSFVLVSRRSSLRCNEGKCCFLFSCLFMQRFSLSLSLSRWPGPGQRLADRASGAACSQAAAGRAA